MLQRSRPRHGQFPVEQPSTMSHVPLKPMPVQLPTVSIGIQVSLHGIPMDVPKKSQVPNSSVIAHT